MDAILVPYHLDERVDGLAFAGATVVHAGTLPDAPAWARLAHLYEPVAAAVARVERPLVVSGDCTTALGALAGLQRRGIDPAVVWLDAHGDFNTHETTLSGYLGGMPLALAVGRGDATVRDRLGLRPVREERVVLADARDLDPPERAALDASAVRRSSVADLVPPDGDLYVHVDIDVLDPTELAGLRFPAPGGPPLATVVAALRRLSATRRILGVGLALTFDPDRTSRGQVSAVIASVLAALDA
ncbi:MAG TPA: arginase family protein [Haliangiales bacterium]|nr:arginase family protein [Haliangiales bacterium]